MDNGRGSDRMVESFLSLLQGKPSSRTVWTADLEYWIAGQEEAGTADPAWRTEEGFLDLCAGLQVMPYYWYQAFWLARPTYDQSVSVTVNRSLHRTRTTWKTPAGEIREEQVYEPVSCSVAHTKFAVESEDDLRVMLDLMEKRTLQPANIEEYAGRFRKWRARGGLPSIALPRSPLSAFFYEWAGLVRGMYLLEDHRRLVERILTLMQEQEEPVLGAVAQAAPPLVHFADNLSGNSMGGYYERYLRPVHENRLAVLHRAGTRCAVHLDGTVKGLLSKVVQAGFDAVEAITPAPGGDMAVESIRKEAGSETVILWGGLPGILFSPPFTWTDVKAHLQRVLDCWKGTPFVLGVADQIPPDGDISYCARIADMVG